jgi:acyl-CoA thioester hydrolase
MVDVDLEQINFCTYFRWMDIAYTQMLVDLGHPLSELLATGISTPIVNARCSYRIPVGLDDLLDIRSWISDIGRSSYQVNHEFSRAKEVVAKGAVKHVWITRDPPQPVEVPTWLRDAGGFSS